MATKIQFRRGTAAQWTAANPLLSLGELGLETDTALYKIGDGVTSWNSLAYGTLALSTSVQNLIGQSSNPSVPSTGNLKIYAKSLSGRMLLRQIGPSGLSSPLQPSFFQNQIIMINTSATTAVGTIGMTVTSVGTLSHPAPTEQYGYMTNFAGAASLSATAGTGNLTPIWSRGSLAGGSNGFFMNQRLAFPDASYNQTGVTTGSRAFVGLTSQTMASSVASDNPAGHLVGFFRCHTDTGLQHTNWQIATKDNVTLTLADTGLPFIATDVYDFYLFCPPQGSTVFWRIDDLTAGTTAEGSVTSTLPGASTQMRMGFQIFSVDAVARNIKMNRVYGESDR